MRVGKKLTYEVGQKINPYTLNNKALQNGRIVNAQKDRYNLKHEERLLNFDSMPYKECRGLGEYRDRSYE